MDSLPLELLCAIGEQVPRDTLVQFCRVNRRCCAALQRLLFRLYGHCDNWNGPSAVFWAVEMASTSEDASQALALAILDKVDRFCGFGPGDLDRSYHRHLGHYKKVFSYNCRTRSDYHRDGMPLFYATHRTFWARRLGEQASMSPLQLAALKGLDGIVAWLLQHGADVNAHIEKTSYSALVAAVLYNHLSTSLVLLAHGADPAVDMPYVRPSVRGRNRFRSDTSTSDGLETSLINDKKDKEDETPTVTILAAAVGHMELAEQLLDAASDFPSLSSATTLTQVLAAYALFIQGTTMKAVVNIDTGACSFVARLVHRGAEVTPYMLRCLAPSAGHYWYPLPLAMLEAMTVDSDDDGDNDEDKDKDSDGTKWTPALVNMALLSMPDAFRSEAAKDHCHDSIVDKHYDDTDIALVRRALPCLLRLPGADVDDCARDLWRQWPSHEFDHALIGAFLPPFLEAGLDVRTPPPPVDLDLVKRLKEERCRINYFHHSSTSEPKSGPDDLLAATSRYYALQCSENMETQLDLVRLLLQHGAPIKAATREFALRDLPIGPSIYHVTGRSLWCVKLTNVLLEHCQNTPEEEQTEDMQSFLEHYRERTKRMTVGSEKTSSSGSV